MLSGYIEGTTSATNQIKSMVLLSVIKLETFFKTQELYIAINANPYGVCRENVDKGLFTLICKNNYCLTPEVD